MACHPVAVDNKAGQSPLASIVPAVIAFAAGISLPANLTASLPPTFYWTIFTAAAITVFILHHTGKQTAAFTILIPLFFTLGIIRAAPFSSPPSAPSDIFNQIQNRSEVTVAGILTQMPAIPAGRCRIQVAAEQLIFPDGTIAPTSGMVLLTMQNPLPDNIEPGDRLVARAVLKRPRTFLTPGVFDYGQHLAWNNIRVTGWISSPALIEKLQPQSPPPLFEQLRYLPERLRHRVGTFLARTLDQQTSSLYRALLLGDRSGVDPVIIENFTTTGCIHLLAISGTHMGLIAIMTTFLSAWLLKRSTRLLLYLPIWKMAALISLPVLFSYALLAGFQTPAVRALTMTVVFLIAILIDRQWSIPVNIAIAALLLLTWQPTLIHTASFQLSFTAVIAIAMLYPHLETLFTPKGERTFTASRKLHRWLLAGLAASTAATVGVLPLLLLHFNRFSIFSPVSTLLVEPFLCLWALTIGLLACLLLPLSPWLAGNLLSLGSLGLHSSLFLTSSLAALPFASFRLPTPTPIEVCLYYATLIAFSQRHRFRLATPLAITALLALGGLFILDSTLAARDNIVRVTILDVGQGSATVLELPGNRAILLDGGSYLGDQFDVGERIIAPFLWRQRITRLEAVVVSHPHADHYNGLPFILNNFTPKTLWTNGRPDAAPAYKNLLRVAQELGIAIKTPQPHTPLYADNGIRLESIGTPPPPPADLTLPQTTTPPGPTTNRSSLVLRLVCNSQTFLFPGDIDTEAERRLVQERDGIAAEVLLAPHHGSGGSLSDSFMKAVAADYIVISVGTTRPGGMAEEGAINKWRRAGATVFNTADDGAVFFTTDGTALTATTAKQTYR